MLKHYRAMLLSIVLTGLYTPVSLAVTATAFLNSLLDTPFKFVMSSSAGPLWESAGRTQTLTLSQTPAIIKTYVANRANNSLGSYDLFLGVQCPLAATLHGQIGLDFATAGNARVAGVIWDDGDPLFDNYTYKYDVHHYQIGVKAKLLGDLNNGVQPWISAMAGMAFNQSLHFTNTPIIYTAIATPNYASNMMTAFTYTVGIGLQRSLSAHLQVGVGYEFSDWGHSRLGVIHGGTTNQTLSLSHLYTSSVLVSLSYLT